MRALPKQVYNGNIVFTLMGAMRGQYQCLWIFKLVWAIFGIGNLKVFLRGPSPASGWSMVAGLWVAPVPVTELLQWEAQTMARPALQWVVLPECFSVQTVHYQNRRAQHQHCVYTVGGGTDHWKRLSKVKQVAVEGFCQVATDEVDSKFCTWFWWEGFLFEIGKGMLMGIIRIG